MQASSLRVLCAQAARSAAKSADASSLHSFAPAIAMMKAAETRMRDHFRGWRRSVFHRPPIWRVLIEGIANAVFVVVLHIIANQPAQMVFGQRDDMVEDLASTASDPPFRDPLLPRCLNTRLLRLEAGCPQEGDHVGVKF